MFIGINYPNSAFTLSGLLVERFTFHEDLAGNHNPDIDYTGSLSFSQGVTLYAPLNMLQVCP